MTHSDYILIDDGKDYINDVIKIICRTNGCEFCGNRRINYKVCPECQAEGRFYLDGVDL